MHTCQHCTSSLTAHFLGPPYAQPGSQLLYIPKPLLVGTHISSAWCRDCHNCSLGSSDLCILILLVCGLQCACLGALQDSFDCLVPQQIPEPAVSACCCCRDPSNQQPSCQQPVKPWALTALWTAVCCCTQKMGSPSRSRMTWVCRVPCCSGEGALCRLCFAGCALQWSSAKWSMIVISQSYGPAVVPARTG